MGEAELDGPESKRTESGRSGGGGGGGGGCKAVIFRVGGHSFQADLYNIGYKGDRHL
jgi:hypothetical protein